MPQSKKPQKDLVQSRKFLLKEVERIDKLEARLEKAGNSLHPVSRGFLDQIIERRSDHRSQIEDIERAIRDLESGDAARTHKTKNK